MNKLRLIAALLGLALLIGVVAPLTAGDPSAPGSTVIAEAPATTPPIGTGVVHIGITVDDLDKSIDFYTRALDFKKVGEFEIVGREYEQLTGVFGARARVARLKLGDEEIELTEYLTAGGREVPRDSRSNDRWFQHIAIITSDMDKAYARLREFKVRHASSGPQRLPDWNKNAGGIRAFYFLDPDRHVLEVLQFPAGKGQARWQSKNRLFLGIDHTAIVVSDTEKSLRFYRDTLGMRVLGGSENYGDEQEHLNNVFGARLRITTLTAGAGPAVEFLEYLSPTNGRGYPADAKSNDLFHWHTTVRTGKADEAWDTLRKARTPMLSPGPVTVSLGDSAQTMRGFLTRDPDGHAVQLIGE